MKNIQALRERRNALAQSMTELLDKHQEKWSPEHQESYDAGIAEMDDIDASIKRITDLQDRVVNQYNEERLQESGARFERDGKNPAAKLYGKWLRGGDKALNADDWHTIRATMSTGTGSEGGFTVQSEVAAQIIEALKAFGGMRDVAEIITTEGGNPLSFPTSDGTSEVGELVAENAAATSSDPSFGTVALNVFKYGSKIITVPIELLQDSESDIEAFVNSRIGTRLGRITNQHFTTGTGTAQPRGVVTASAVGKVGAVGQTVTVTYDDLVDLEHSVDPAYRPGARWMMNDASVGKIRKLKDTQGRPIWIPSYDLSIQGGTPDRLLNWPITVNQDVAAMAANAKSILFGNFSQYKIRDVMQVTLFRFTDSAFMSKGQVGFLAWMRSGGNLVDTGAIKHYANSAT